jgi:hypothetical protein
MLEIAFWGEGAFLPRIRLTALDDRHIELARQRAEKRWGPLVLDARTRYPSYVIYKDGKKIREV